MSVEDVLKKWQHRQSSFLAVAEQACYEGDSDQCFHLCACARQWANAIEELRRAEPS